MAAKLVRMQTIALATVALFPATTVVPVVELRLSPAPEGGPAPLAGPAAPRKPNCGLGQQQIQLVPIITDRPLAYNV